MPSFRSGIIGIFTLKETLVSRFVEGVVTLTNIVSQMVNNKAVPTDSVEKVMLRHFRKVNLDTTLGRLARIFEKDSYAVVVTTERHLECKLYIKYLLPVNIHGFVKS